LLDVHGVKPTIYSKGEGTKNPDSEHGDYEALPGRRRRLVGMDDGRSYRYVTWRRNRSQYRGIESLRNGVCLDCLRIGDERRVGFGIVHRLALLKPLIQLAGVGVDGGFFLMLVAPDRKPFGSLPALDGASFASEMCGNLFPGN
jgi:hypothetical protein